MGKIIIKLDDYLKTNQISRCGAVRDSGVRYDTLLRYCKGTITKLDIDTLARLCQALGCKVEDIIEYVPD